MTATCLDCAQSGEINGRGLCKPCYDRHYRAGTLARYPTTIRRSRVRIVGEERQTLAKDLVKRYADGESIRALASSIGRSYGFVHDMLTESGVELRQRGGPNGRRLTNQDIEAIRRLLGEGGTVPALASKFDVDVETVRDIRNGRTWRNAGGRP